MKNNSTFTAVDLFAGGGGLTVGLKKAGFKVVGAVEIEEHALATYEANHKDVKTFCQDIRSLSGKELLAASPTGKIDLLAGCPPCQGFSSLTAKYKKTDPRNFLIREMGRLVEEVRPNAIMMENVPGLTQKGHPLFNEFIRKIERLGYKVEHRVLQVADYGVPQSRRRLVLFAGLGYSIPFPEATHSKSPSGKQKAWVTVKETIKDMPKPISLDKALKEKNPMAYDWHVVRKLSEENLARLKSTKAGECRTSIPEELRPKCHQNLSKGFGNVYGRMSWNTVSPTMTGGCTTLSKGRFGHPSQNRTISVREAALLQTFPKNYKFNTPYMDRVCNIIGNALPCTFAKAMSKAVLVEMKKNQISFVKKKK
jgi:DNA (cytosine-5)-methyltransferase 1